MLNEVLNEDAFESLQIPVDRAWLLAFCYSSLKNVYLALQNKQILPKCTQSCILKADTAIQH